MKVINLMIKFTLILFFILNQCHSKVVFISRTSCSIQYSQNSSSIVFNKCDGPGFQSHNWIQCFLACCNDGVPDQYRMPSVRAISACRTGIFPSSGLSTEKVIYIVLGSIIAFGVCISFLFKMCKKWKTKKVEPLITNWVQQIIINNNSDLLQWSDKASSCRPLKISQNPCCICLEQNTFAQLICHHQYHPQCIGNWLRKNNCCPVCRHDHIRGVKIYCSNCRWRYFVCTNSLVMEKGQSFTKRCRICQKDKEEVTDSLVEVAPEHSHQVIKEIMNVQNWFQLEREN